MLWELVGVADKPKRLGNDRYQSLRGRFQVMPQLASYQERIENFINRCLTVKADERLSVDEALDMVKRWQDE
jgi:hypothetical protein